MFRSKTPRYRGTWVRPGILGTVAVVCLVVMTACSSAVVTARKVVPPSPSPSAAPIPGAVVFSDSFAKVKRGWTANPAGSGSYPAGGGYLLKAGGGTDAFGEAPYSSTTMDGIAVSASAEEKSGDARSGYFGVGCDLGYPDAQYEFVVDASGNYYIGVADITLFNILSAGHAASMRSGGVANEIQGSCTHGALSNGTLAVRLQFSVNGAVVATVFDTAPAHEAGWGGGVLVTSPASTDPAVSVLFTSFSMTDLAKPGTLGTNPVVYADTLGNPDTGWDTHRWDANDDTAYGAGAFDIKADGWVETSPPYLEANLKSVHITVTAKVVGGAAETLSGVFCANEDDTDPQYIFFASPNGTWEIDGLPNVNKAPVALLSGHFARGAAKTVTVAGSCTASSSGGGHYTTLLAITVNGKHVGTKKAIATGAPHLWGGGLMTVTFQGDPAATVSFTNFSVLQLAP